MWIIFKTNLFAMEEKISISNTILFWFYSYLIYSMKKIFWILIIGGLLFLNISNVWATWETTNNTGTKDKTSSSWMVEWIEMNSECLTNGQCKFKIYDLLKIRKSVETEWADSTSPDIFVQDIVLAATFFIWTVVTIAIIVSGLMFIFAGATGKDPSKAKSGLINSLIWLLIVISSYSIIRLVQYIAKGF